LFYKNSGPGIWAFYLTGFVEKDIYGNRNIIESNGFFLVKRNMISETEYKEKFSLKHKTYKKGNLNETTIK